jgi:AraC-like DNA-binding protein
MMTGEEAMIHAELLERRLRDEIAEPPHLTVVEATSVAPQPQMLPYFDFTPCGETRSEQFEGWRNSFGAMLELTDTADQDATRPFTGRQTVWDLGSMILAEITTDRLSFSSLPGHVRRDPVDHWTMTLLTSGFIQTETSRTSFSAGPGEVQIHSLGRVFDGDVRQKSRMLMLFVPRDFSVETAVTLGQSEFSTLSTGMGRLFSDYLTDVSNRLKLLQPGDLPGLAAATRAMILACVSPSRDHIEAAEGPIATVLLERARKLVQSRLLDPKLGSEMVRRELGISRTRLYNLFEPFGGVMHYIQHRRLQSAYAALTDPSDRRLIFQIAEERGFSDGAEFSRAFKRAFGDSPSDIRKRGGGGMPSRHSLDDCSAEERLGLLLRRLQG